MPQLDEIDIFSRDHMTVDKFDPQGNLIDRKIIFSRPVEDTPIFDSDMELFERAMQSQGSQDPAEIAAKIRSRIDSGEYKMNLRPEDQYVRMIDPTTGAFVEVENNLPTILSYIDAGYQPEMAALGGMGGPATRTQKTPKRGFKGKKYPSAYSSKGSVSDKEYESFRDSLKNQDIFGYSLGGSVSEMMGRTGPDLTPAQIANLAGAFADPYGGADLTGNYPEFPARGVSVEEMLRGPRAPSFLENLRQGNFGDAAFQGIGALPIPFLAGAMKYIKAGSKIGKVPLDQAEKMGYKSHIYDDEFNLSPLSENNRPSGVTKTPFNEAKKFSEFLSQQGIMHKSDTAKTGTVYITVEGGPMRKTISGDPMAGEVTYRFGDHDTGFMSGRDNIQIRTDQKQNHKDAIDHLSELENVISIKPQDPRMLRAAEQGFDTSTVYYHGADSDIEEFLLPSKERGQTRTADTGIFFTKSPAIASTYSLYPGVKKAEELGRAGSVYPVYLNKKDFIKITSKDFKTGEVAPRMWSRLDLDEMYVTLPDGKEQSIYDYLGLDLETAPPGLLTTDKISKMVRDKTDAKGIIFENVYDTGSGLFDLRKAEFGYENYYDRKGILEPNFEPPKQRFDLSAEAEKPSEIVVAFDPKNIRSVNAQFADKPDTELPPLSRSEGGIVEDVDIFGADQGMYRADGAKKSARGFIGPIRNLITGGTMTELSTDMEYDGRKIQIPTMVPTLSQEEISYLQNMQPGKGWDMDNPVAVSVISKARAHARKRLDEGKNPFYQDDEGYLQNLQEFSLGGSVGDMIREQAGVERQDIFTPAQLANIAGGFADPLGATDTLGLYPEFPTDRSVTIKDMASSDYPRSPSAAENLARGDYLNLGLQSLGFVPILGGMARTIRSMGKMPPSIVDPLSTDASGLLTGRTGFGPEAELAQAKDTPPQLARIIDDESVLQKQYAKDLTVPELAKLANKKSAASFLNFMDTFPAAREMATVAQAGLAKKGWYRQSAQALYDVFGDEAPRFAALLAATSPQTSVQGNLLNATSIWRNLTQNNMPRDPVLFDIINEPGVAAALKLKKNVPLKNADGSPQLNKAGNQKYGLRNISEQEAREVIKKAGGGDSTFDVGRMQIEIMGDAVQGEKGAESVLDAWVSNSIRAINVPDDEMDKLVLSGPKVDSFMRNLVNNTVEVTNDTWMANYLGVEQNVFGGSLNPARIDPGKGPGYLAANALTRNASRILSDRLGENVTPEMIQEMVWSWSKAVFEQSRAVGMSPREFIQKGRLTDAMINDVPDFSSLLRDPDLPYRNILKASGATVGQFKKGEIPKGNRTEEIMRSSETARRNLERAANRLKFIKADQLALGAIVPLVAINIVNMGKVPDEEEGSSEIDNIDIFN